VVFPDPSKSKVEHIRCPPGGEPLLKCGWPDHIWPHDTVGAAHDGHSVREARPMPRWLQARRGAPVNLMDSLPQVVDLVSGGRR